MSVHAVKVQGLLPSVSIWLKLGVTRGPYADQGYDHDRHGHLGPGQEAA
jgi:hypothetical protein